MASRVRRCLPLVAALCTTGLHAADTSTGITKQVDAVAADLRRRIVCPSAEQVSAGHWNCKLEFRGLSVHFAGAKAPDGLGGGVYIHFMGKNQIISAVGSRCLQVVFNDDDLKVRGNGVYILLRNDATIEVDTYDKKMSFCS